MTELRVLVVDDEAQLVRVLLPSLTAAGYEAEAAGTGRDALAALSATPFDAVILDLGLPDLDGKEVIAAVRERSVVPIIVLSARDEEQEKIDALDRGANDFVNKPFRIGELLARLRAATRTRRVNEGRDVFDVGHLHIDFAARKVSVKGKDIRPSSRELKLLRTFVERLDEVLTYRQIITSVWGADAEVEAQFVRVLVGNLRQKIELNPSVPEVIITEAGVGYRMRGRLMTDGV
jgi:two-component system KDP operon response regulator KdpE